MPASEARIRANQLNSLKSTGPRTEVGKARSRGNAVKHGLTGEGVTLPAEDAEEVERLQRSFEAELKPSGDLGRTLVRRMALMSVRMDRCVLQESASLSDRVRQAEADFDVEWPEVEGQDDPHRERMRVEAANRAMFDPSREATLARKYEAAAERCFFRSLKELRQVEGAAKATSTGPEIGEARAALGSFLPAEAMLSALGAVTAGTPQRAPATAPKAVAPASKPLPKPVPALPVAPRTPLGGAFELPFSIGRVG